MVQGWRRNDLFIWWTNTTLECPACKAEKREKSARFGVSLRVTPAHPDGAWLPEAHQTPEQARLLQEYMDSGKSAWRPVGVAGMGKKL